MKLLNRFLIVLFATTITVPALAEDAATTELPDRESFHLFLLAGQSNMAGRGKVAAEDKVVHPRVLALGRDGKWHPAVDPLHWDKGSAGVGLGKSFAIALAEKNTDIVIGLIPAACGGSPISTWQPGGYHGQTKSHPYDDAIKRAKIAMNNGVLRGILWHQGESDSNPKAAATHQKELTELIARFRQDLNAPTVPFIIGQLGQFEARPWSDSRTKIDVVQKAVAEKDEFAGFVSSSDLSSKSDNIHFDAASLRRFGKRYANTYVEMTDEEAANAGAKPCP